MIERRTPGILERARPHESPDPIKRLLIDDRGEMAVRIIQAAHEEGIPAVLLTDKSGSNSLAVRTALSYDFPVAALNTSRASKSFANAEVLRAVADRYGCDRLHPGYGYAAENAPLARELRDGDPDVSIRYVGPPPEAIEKYGDKNNARELAKKVGVPVLEGSHLLSSVNDALKYAHDHKFPLMIKAPNAGGGKGNKDVYNEEQLKIEFERLHADYGDLYIERYLPRAKHIELQIAADAYGNVQVLGARDCSAQRKHQKVFEEGGQEINVPESTLHKMGRGAIRMARHGERKVRYRDRYKNLGTWEYLYDPDKDEFYFLEVNTRLQVEHPVTEVLLGENLIKRQLRIEAGHPNPPLPEQRKLHAMEMRVYAEDPDRNFAGQGGSITDLVLPQTGDGVRVDLGVDNEVPKEHDKTIMKIVTSAATREEAREKMAKALTELTVHGVKTNKEFLLWLINTKEVRENNVTTTFIEEAWSKYRRERLRNIDNFFGDGSWEEQERTRTFRPEKYSQNIQYQRLNHRTGEREDRDYAKELSEMHEKYPGQSSFRYGTYTEGGVDLAFGFFDFSRFGGTLGVEEGADVNRLFDRAAEKKQDLHNKRKTPDTVVIVSTSAGARQQENAAALYQMPYTVSGRVRHKDVPFIAIMSGENFGGLNASILGQADVRIAIEGSQIGLTGPDMQARLQGKKDRRDLAPGTYSAADHYDARTVDYIAEDLEEARLWSLAYAALAEKLPQDVLEDRLIALRDKFRSFEASVGKQSADKRSRLETHFANPIKSFFETHLHKPRHRGEVYVSPPQTKTEQLDIIHDADRPTTADIIAEFDYVIPLSRNAHTKDGRYGDSPVIAAIGFKRIDGKLRAMGAIGEQTQRRRDPATGQIKKEYEPQRAADYRWATHILKDVFEKLDIPVLTICDTQGASAALVEEYNGISNEISNMQAAIADLNVPVQSEITGEDGSGGGIPFAIGDKIRRSRFSIVEVSQKGVQTEILVGERPTLEQETVIFEQLNDSTAQVGVDLHQADEATYEPNGGAQMKPKEYSDLVIMSAYGSLAELEAMHPEERKVFRHRKLEHMGEFVSTPYSST